MTQAFTHVTGGTDPARWRSRPWWSSAPVIALPPASTRLIVLAAHPDDETLGVGALLHAAAVAGHVITVVVASDGDASHPDSPTHPPARLVEIRREEVVAAVARLAPDATVVRLGLPDGRLADHVDAVTSALAAVVPDDVDVWLLSTWIDDAHPDHEACAVAARRVAAVRPRVRAFEYPVWWWHWGDPAAAHPADAVRRFVPSAADVEARDAAIGLYPSQIAPLGPEPGNGAVLPAAVLAHFVGRDRDVLLDVVPRSAVGVDHFDALYAASSSPWGETSRWYERRRRSVLLAALPRERFARTFEPGCGAGDLSVLLAERSDELWCADIAAAAVTSVSARLSPFPGARAVRLDVPAEWAPGRFDLVVVSEVGYYVPDLLALADRISAGLTDDGVVALVHWRRTAASHPHTTEAVHATVAERTGLARLVHHEEDDFLLDVLARDPRSVAERDGVL